MKYKKNIQVSIHLRRSCNKDDFKERLKTFLGDDVAIKGWRIIDEGLSEGGYHSI